MLEVSTLITRGVVRTEVDLCKISKGSNIQFCRNKFLCIEQAQNTKYAKKKCKL